MKNVAYLRVSTNEQDVNHQKSSIQDYCARNNITLDKIIADEGISAYSTDISQRSGLQQILHLAHEGSIDNLIIFESSRLSRQFLQGQMIINELTQCGVTIHSVTEGILNQNELDEIMNSFRFFMNKKASQETSARVKSAKKMLRDKGLHQGHRVLWGFKVVDKKEVIDEEKEDLVKKMFDIYIAHGSKKCIEFLKNNGMGNISSHHQVLSQRLRNEKYIKIVGESTFKMAQQLLESRRTNKKGNNTKGLNRSDIIYEGLLFHGNCCRKLIIDKDRKANPIFRCRHCKGTPNKKSFTGIPLMNNIDFEVMQILNTLDRKKLEERYNNRCSGKKKLITLRINELNNLLKSKQKALSLANAKLEKLILNEISENAITVIADKIVEIKEEIQNVSEELHKKEEELNNIQLTDKTHNELINKIIEIKDIYASATNEKKKVIVNILIKKIVVYDIDRFDIHLNI